MNRLLLVLPSVVGKVGTELGIDFDFSENLRLYLEAFEHVTVACPVIAEPQDYLLGRYRLIREFPWGKRFNFIPLPNAYRIGTFLREFGAVRRLLKHEIQNADCLVFSPHTLVGDWPTVAVREAIKLKRNYVIEADVVYEKVDQVGWHRITSRKRSIKKYLILPLFQRFHRYCLEKSSLALLQGQDVYDAYASRCSNPHKVYHIPISDGDYITPTQLQSKLDGLETRRPLSLCYVGRAIDMKGPIDWLKTVHRLIESGVEINAIWVGGGSLIPEMRRTIKDLALTDKVLLPGYISDRQKILQILRETDIFLFCHKTPESPRCLVEALASGCPIVGYASGYPKELVANCGGGRFAVLGNWNELANTVRDLDKDRSSLCNLIQTASASGRLYERDKTMQHRIDLIKKHMTCGVSLGSLQ